MRKLRVCAFGAACLLLTHATASSRSVSPAMPSPPAPPNDEAKIPVPCGHAARQAALWNATARVDTQTDDDTDVLHYDLDIEILPEYTDGEVSAVRVTGTSTIQAQPLVGAFSLFIVDLESNMLVKDVTGNVDAWSREEGEDTVNIHLDRTYQPGETFSVSIAYTGSPISDGCGAFDWWLRDDALFVATLSQPFYAHHWWPCKDALNDKATMSMHVTVPDGMVAVSNGTAIGHEVLADGRIRWDWQESYPMVTYLASFAAGPYQRYDLEYVPDDSTQVLPVPCYLYPDHWDFETGMPTDENLVGCEEITEMLATFSGKYGPYPFLTEKYGVVETGGYGGFGASMEHQTISSMYQVAWYSDIMAHELAHQWWGDEVTCQTWEDIWLNEGFATYSEAIHREYEPGGGMDGYWDRMNERKPPNPDAQVYRTSTDSVDEIFSLNDVYQKGAWVMHMLRHVMGDEAFFQALADYRETYRHDSVTTEEFTESFSQSFGEDLSWFVDQWVMRPGSPDYLWRYDVRRIGGRPALVVSISQTQDRRGYDLFTMPLDLYVETEASSQTIRLWNDAWRQFYVIPLDAPPVTVTLDQDHGDPSRHWVLGHTFTWSNVALDTSAVEGSYRVMERHPLPACIPGAPALK